MQSGYSSPYNSLTTVIKQLNMNSYELSRKFVDFSFENPSKIKPNHYALYFFSIEHCNRLGWKKEFGLPTTMTMEAIGIRSYNTYSKTFNDLVDFGFFNLIERSSNQYSANIIGLSNFNKALDKALDKAFIKHGTKQSESTEQSIDSINKQITNNKYTKEQVTSLKNTVDKFLNEGSRDNNTFKERKQKFILWFNQQKKKATGKDSNLKVLSTTDDNNLKKLLDGGYEISEFQIAFNNMLKSEWVKQNGMASISHLIRLDNFNKYLTQGENDYKPKMTNLYD